MRAFVVEFMGPDDREVIAGRAAAAADGAEPVEHAVGQLAPRNDRSGSVGPDRGRARLGHALGFGRTRRRCDRPRDTSEEPAAPSAGCGGAGRCGATRTAGGKSMAAILRSKAAGSSPGSKTCRRP